MQSQIWSIFCCDAVATLHFDLDQMPFSVDYFSTGGGNRQYMIIASDDGTARVRLVYILLIQQ